MSAARQTPMYDPISHLVYVTRGDDVQTTIVNGKVLMRDRKVLTIGSRQPSFSDAATWADKVRAAVNHDRESLITDRVHARSSSSRTSAAA